MDIEKRGENYRNCCLRQSVTFNSCRRLICMKRQRNLMKKREREFLRLKRDPHIFLFQAHLLENHPPVSDLFSLSLSPYYFENKKRSNRNLRSSNESSKTLHLVHTHTHTSILYQNTNACVERATHVDSNHKHL